MARPAASISTEDIPIDEWFARSAAHLWGDYVSARAAANDLCALSRFALANETSRLARDDEAQALLHALVNRSKRGEIEVWGGRDSPFEALTCIRPSAAFHYLSSVRRSALDAGET